MSSVLNFAVHGGTAGCPENVPSVDVIVKCVIYQWRWLWWLLINRPLLVSDSLWCLILIVQYYSHFIILLKLNNTSAKLTIRIWKAKFNQSLVDDLQVMAGCFSGAADGHAVTRRGTSLFPRRWWYQAPQWAVLLQDVGTACFLQVSLESLLEHSVMQAFSVLTKFSICLVHRTWTSRVLT